MMLINSEAQKEKRLNDEEMKINKHAEGSYNKGTRQERKNVSKREEGGKQEPQTFITFQTEGIGKPF